MRYRSKPTECEAAQWCSRGCTDLSHESMPQGGVEAESIVAWVNANGGEARHEPAMPADPLPSGLQVNATEARIAVRTINGWAYAAPGHCVVMGTATFRDDHVHECPTCMGQLPERGVYPDAATGQSERLCENDWHDEWLRDFYPCDPETFEKRWEPCW